MKPIGCYCYSAVIKVEGNIIGTVDGVEMDLDTDKIKIVEKKTASKLPKSLLERRIERETPRYTTCEIVDGGHCEITEYWNTRGELLKREFKWK